MIPSGSRHHAPRSMRSSAAAPKWHHDREVTIQNADAAAAPAAQPLALSGAPPTSDSPGIPLRRRLVRSTLGWVMTAALAVAAIVALRLMGVGSQIVLTSSMAPAILAGDAVITVGSRLHQPEIGDVVVYHVRWGSEELPPISHRIVASRGPGVWTTKGDYNAEDDPWPVPQERISGVVILRVPLHYFRDSRVAGTTVGAMVAAGVAVLFWPRRRVAAESVDPADDPSSPPRGRHARER